MAANETSNGAPGAADEPALGRDADLKTEAADARINLIALDRLSHAFEYNARRTELMVYPFLFAFIILAAYGFYLVFSLAEDVHSLAVSVDTNMQVLARNMDSVSLNLGQLSGDVRRMSVSVDSIAGDVKTMEPMLGSIVSMDRSMRDMTLNTTVMRDDMAALSRNIGRPMRLMNSFMPW